MVESNCPYGDDSLVVADYLAGRLSRARAQAFEVHSFGCERCFEELQRAVELRASSRDEPATEDRHPIARTRRRSWPSLAVAASVVLAIGVWFAQPLLDDPEAPVERVYRDVADGTDEDPGLHLVVDRNNDRVSLSWTEVQSADSYEVRVFSERGDPVFEQQTDRTSIELAVAEWQGSGPPGRFYGQVIARDELRQIIVQSDAEPL